MNNRLGPIALIGSGETSLAGGRIFETLAKRFRRPLHIAILETPAGFELNSNHVAGRIGEFLKNRLQNYEPQIKVIPARKRGTSFSPDDPITLQPLLSADLIFMGPGSPTYAVRQLKGSLAWELTRARHRQGAGLVLASAAVIAVSAFALPIYEIYKVGEDVSVVSGLDLFKDFNFHISILPHWNNTEGGDDVDTSRCFIGIERFNQWCGMLPAKHTTVGLDEHTGLIIDFDTAKCTVDGVSSVTLLRACNPQIYPAGAEFPITELGDFRARPNTEVGISPRAWEMTENGTLSDAKNDAPVEVGALLEKRMQARLRKDWVEADALRKQIGAYGWIVKDTPEGQKVFRQS